MCFSPPSFSSFPVGLPASRSIVNCGRHLSPAPYSFTNHFKLFPPPPSLLFFTALSSLSSDHLCRAGILAEISPTVPILFRMRLFGPPAPFPPLLPRPMNEKYHDGTPRSNKYAGPEAPPFFSRAMSITASLPSPFFFFPFPSKIGSALSPDIVRSSTPTALRGPHHVLLLFYARFQVTCEPLPPSLFFLPFFHDADAGSTVRFRACV